MTSFKKVWWISLFIKLLLATSLPLSADEAYYWVWSQFPQLSYFDHPPFVAWLFKIGSFLPLNLIRWPAIVLFHLGFLFWFQILKSHLSEKQILGWLVLCLFCPLLGLGPILVLPDTPLFFFFSGSLYFFFQCLEKSRFHHYCAFGAFLGLGFLSKYLIVIPAFLLAVFIIKEKIKEPLRSKNLLAIIIFGLLFSSPVLIWNWLNNFRSFQFQLEHGLAAGSWQWHWTANYILGTLLLMFPLNLFWSLKSAKDSFNKIFLFLTFGGFLFFLFSSFKGPVELNWPAIFFPCLFVLSIQAVSKKVIFSNSLYWLSIYTLIAVLIKADLTPALKQKFDEPTQVKLLSKLPYEFSPLYASTYQLASLLWWNSQKPVYKLKSSSRYDFFDELEGSLPSTSVFYLIKEPGNNLPDWVQLEGWSIEEVQKPNLKHIVLKISKKDNP